jgi:hypothetical protein
MNTAIAWLERVDPGAHRRIKGLRLVTAYGIAAALGTLQGVARDMPAHVALGALAGNFALWASVSEGRCTRAESSRDLALLCAAAGFGAMLYAMLAPPMQVIGRAGPELTLVTGAFAVGYLKRFGVLGAGIGSQIYIGQLLAYGSDLTVPDAWAICAATIIAAVAAIVPRVLSGPAERPVPFAAISSQVPGRPGWQPEFVMGLQAAIAALVIVVLNNAIGLEESAWAITASTYTVAGSSTGTALRVRSRLLGTLVGVPLALACLPLAQHMPLLVWTAAAAAMIVYAMALPERYDIACGAFAFTLIVTLAASGVHSIPLLAARAWETLLGGVVGLAAARFLLPLRAKSAAE